MVSLTVRGNSRLAKRQDAAALPSLLEFHSPSAALSVAPVLRGARGISWTVSSLAVACLAAAGLIPVDKVVTAPGKIIAENATSVVQPLEIAIVRSVDVREGQLVKKGDLLARLDPTFATADAGALQAQVDSLQSEVDRLTAEASNRTYSPANATPMALMQKAIATQRASERAFKMEGYAQKINGLRYQIQRAMADVTGYQARLKVAQELESKRVELERAQVGSAINRLDAMNGRMEVERGLGGAMAQAAQGAQDLRAMEAERDGYDQSWRSQVNQDLTEASRKLSDAKENLNKAVLRRRLVELRADQDSTVLNIAKVSPGSVLQPGEQLMSLTPIDAPLQVEVNVPGTEAGFVQPGNPVTIKLGAFSPTQYGTLAGRISTMSPDSFTGNPDEKQRNVQQMPASGPTYYRGRITIDENKLHDTPPGFRLVPGMPVDADVKVGKRTVLSYLFSRVLPVAMDGMREP